MHYVSMRTRTLGEEQFAHVWSVQLVAQLPIVVPGPHSRDDENLLGAVLLSGDALCLLHQKGAVALMLKLGRITSLKS